MNVTDLRALGVRARTSGLEVVLVTVVSFLLAFGAVAWRSAEAPDIFSDEILYTRASLHVAGEGALIWDTGRPLFVHPPLYFLTLGGYLSLTSDTEGAVERSGDIFAWVYHARLLNALFAGLTAVLLFLIGRRLHGSVLGLLLVVLFVLDPFGVRINRRAMLETLAMLLVLGGMLLLFARRRLSNERGILAGLLFGAALLTKELTFTALLGLLIFWMWERRRTRESVDERRAIDRPMLLLFATAGVTYLLFPLWAVTTGRWDYFLDEKFLSLRRLLGLVQLTGWNRPGVSLFDFLLPRLTDYATSYLLLGLGGLATLWLLATQRASARSRLLASWGLALYPFYSLVALVGSGNDQFFYFLLVPAMILVGYVVMLLPQGLTRLLEREQGQHAASTQRIDQIRSARNLALGVGLALLLSYNLISWVTSYGIGVDNGYRQLRAYVDQNLPTGAAINASGDKVKFRYFFPERPIADAGTPEEARAQGVRYFVLAPKDVWARYGSVTPDLATWLQANGERMFATYGDSYGDIFLYRVADQSGSALNPDDGPLPRTFPQAETGFIDTFLLLLGLWLALLSFFFIGAQVRRERYRG